MRERQTLFESVFQSLEEQILSGRLGVGSRLESINELSARYGVGTRTVREVLRALKEKGYIRTEERKAAVVVYRQAEAGMAAFGPGAQGLDFAGIPHRGGFGAFTAGILHPLLQRRGTAADGCGDCTAGAEEPGTAGAGLLGMPPCAGGTIA